MECGGALGIMVSGGALVISTSLLILGVNDKWRRGAFRALTRRF